uniref:glycosyltransferase family 2 protein n=1 Tax=Falsiroseomonas oryziterrae TaxID=2911368 RepID=UPI001F3F9861
MLPAADRTTTAPRVSVVIPARDAAGFVGAALASAAGQTLRALEIIAVDDGSTDATWTVLERAAAADARIRPLRRARPGGAGAARNLAFAEARGTWLALLDADDLWLPDRLARMVAEAEASGADLLADDLLLRDFETGAELGTQFGGEGAGWIATEELLRRDMPDAPPGPPGAIGYAQPLIRRDFVRAHGLAYDETLETSEDLAFLFACLLAGARFRLSAEALYVYRVRPRSISRRAGVARAQAAANRAMMRLASGRAGPAVMRLLARRQDLLDGAAIAEAAQAGAWLAALGGARWHDPARLARDLR